MRQTATATQAIAAHDDITYTPHRGIEHYGTGCRTCPHTGLQPHSVQLRLRSHQTR